MRKAILMLLLAVGSSGAAAEWVEVRGPESETFTVYADSATIRKVGTVVKMWSLYDYKALHVTPVLSPYMSMTKQYEYDCKEERQRTLFWSSYSGQMSRGIVVQTDTDPNNWSPVAPGTVGEQLWQLACGKR